MLLIAADELRTFDGEEDIHREAQSLVIDAYRNAREVTAKHCNGWTPLLADHSPEIGSAQRVDSIQQIFLAGNSDDLIPQLAVLEKEERRNRPDIVLGRETLVVVYVYFRNFQCARFFPRNLVEQGRDQNQLSDGIGFSVIGSGESQNFASVLDQRVLAAATGAEKGPVAYPRKLNSLQHALEAFVGLPGEAHSPSKVSSVFSASGLASEGVASHLLSTFIPNLRAACCRASLVA